MVGGQTIVDEELKPCPFCGGKAKVYTGEEFFLIGNEKCNSVFCESCQATIRYFQTSKEAMNAWNRRENNGSKTD